MGVIPTDETVDDIARFASRIKTKFPEYQEIPDGELVERVVRKHPVYADRVRLPAEFKLLQTTTGYPKLDDLYERAGRDNNVDPNLLLEQGRQESINFHPDVVYGRKDSPKGARGLGQFMPGTAPKYGLTVNGQVDERADPTKSVPAQARYMRKLLDQFDDNEELALAGYNAGEYRESLKAGKVPQISETQKYVKTIRAALAKARATNGPRMLVQPPPDTLGEQIPVEDSLSASGKPFMRPEDVGRNAGVVEGDDTESPDDLSKQVDELTAIGEAAKEGRRYTGQGPVAGGQQVPVPETTDTLEAQRQSAHDPQSTRSAVLYTPGEQRPPIADGETDLKLPDGRVLRANTQKLQTYLRQNKILRSQIESGKADITPLLGGKADVTADTANKLAVATKDAKGREMVASAIDGPESVPVEAKLQKAQFPNKQTQTVLTSTDAVNAGRMAEPTAVGTPEAPADIDEPKVVDEVDPNAVVGELRYSPMPQGQDPVKWAKDDIATGLEAKYQIPFRVGRAWIEKYGIGSDPRQGDVTGLSPEQIATRVKTKDAFYVTNSDLDQLLHLANIDRIYTEGRDKGLAPSEAYKGLLGQGLIPDEDLTKIIADESAKEAALRQELQTEERGKIVAGLATIRHPATADAREQFSEDKYASAVNAAAEEQFSKILKKYGTIDSYRMTQAMAHDQLRAIKEHRDWMYENNIPQYTIPLQVASNVGQGAVEVVTDLIAASDVVNWALGIPTFGDMFAALQTGEMKNTPAYERSAFEISQGFQKWFKDNSYDDPLLHTDAGASALLNDIPKVLTQVIAQAIAGAATGGVALPTVMGSAQGLMERYAEGVKGGATPEQLRGIVAASAVLAVPEWFSNKLIMAPLMKATGGKSIIDALFDRSAKQLYTRFAAEVGEVEARNLTKAALNGLAAKFADMKMITVDVLKRAVKQTPDLLKAGGFEAVQEVWLEDKINNAVAYYTHDRSQTRWNQVQFLTKQDLLTMGISAAAGAGGNLFGQAASRLGRPSSKIEIDGKQYDVGAAEKPLLRQALAQYDTALETWEGAKRLFDESRKQKTSEIRQKWRAAAVNAYQRGELEYNAAEEMYQQVQEIVGGEGSKSGTPLEKVGFEDVYGKPVKVTEVTSEPVTPPIVPQAAEQNEALTPPITTEPVEQADETAPAVSTKPVEKKGEATPRPTAVKAEQTTATTEDASITPEVAETATVAEPLTSGRPKKKPQPKIPVAGVKPVPVVQGIQLGESATDAAHDAATSPENDLPEPTQPQKEAGNYQKGHISINGLDISIENPQGSERSGVDRDGKKWTVKMREHYGYFKRTIGADEENIDTFVKDGTPNDFAGDVYVVDQVHPDTGKFDEHKVMLGYDSEAEAREAYAANYAKDWKGLKSITAMPMDDFKTWARDGEQTEPAMATASEPKADSTEDIVSATENGAKTSSQELPKETYVNALGTLKVGKRRADGQVETTDEGGTKHLIPENVVRLGAEDTALETEREDIDRETEALKPKLRRVRKSENQSALIDQERELRDRRKANVERWAEIRKELKDQPINEYAGKFSRGEATSNAADEADTAEQPKTEKNGQKKVESAPTNGKSMSELFDQALDELKTKEAKQMAEPWSMTRDEFGESPAAEEMYQQTVKDREDRDYYEKRKDFKRAALDTVHYASVEAAVASGGKVPAKVFDDYPDLAKKYEDMHGEAVTDDVETSEGLPPLSAAAEQVSADAGLKHAEDDVAGPVFYSGLERVIEAKMPNRADAAQIRGIIKDTKVEERDWTGIEEWLDENPNPTKAEVLEFVRANQVEVKEVEKGNGAKSPLQWIPTRTPNLSKPGTIEGLGNGSPIPHGEITPTDQGFIAHLFAPSGDNIVTDDRTFTTLDEAKSYIEGEWQASAIDKYKSDTKFGTYTLPGGENYRELLLTLPPTEVRLDGLDWKSDGAGHWDARDVDGNVFEIIQRGDGYFEVQRNGRGVAGAHTTFEKAERTAMQSGAMMQRDTSYKSPHWDEPNVLAHVRFDTRDGGKTLHVAEIQSDWHQAGREKGYKPSAERIAQLEAREAELDKIRPGTDESVREIVEVRRELAEGPMRGVPAAPFQKSWPMLAMKRMIRYAAENGYERITWDTGETSAERYDLSKHVDRIDYESLAGDQIRVRVHLLDDTELYKVWVDRDTKKIVNAQGSDSGRLMGKQLDDVIGKELAKKIIEDVKPGMGTLRGPDLKVGGEGMKGFYDKILPADVNKYVKKWGGKVEAGKVDAGLRDGGNDTDPGHYINEAEDRTWSVFDADTDEALGGPFPSLRAAETFRADLLKVPATASVHSLTITPAMHDAAMAGQSLFRAEEETADDFRDVKFASVEDLSKKGTIERVRDRVKINLEGQEFLRRLAEEMDIRSGKKRIGDPNYEASFSGQFYEPQKTERMLSTLLAIATQAKAVNEKSVETFAYRLIDEINAARKDGKGTLVAYMWDRRLPHEIFHQASFLGDLTRNLTRRHDKPAELDKHEAVKTAYKTYFSKFDEYSSMPDGIRQAVIREETAAYIASGEFELLGLDETTAAEYLVKWFDSYTAKNGVESLDKFEEIEGQTYEIVQKIKEAYSRQEEGQRNGESGESVPGDEGQTTDGSGPVDGSPPGERGERPEREDQRLRAYPKTLREAGIEAEDDLYDVQHDDPAHAEAVRIFNEMGVAGAMKLIDNTRDLDAVHENLTHLILSSLQAKADEIEASDPAEASDLRKLQLDFARDMAIRHTKAGQYNSAARVAAYSPMTVVLTAEQIVRDAQGDQEATLTPEDRLKFEDMGRALEAAMIDLAENKKKLRSEKARSKRLQDRLDGKTKHRTRNSQMARTHLVDVIREKHAKDIKAAIAELQAHFKSTEPVAPAMARFEADYDREAVLKAIEDETVQPLSPERLEKLSQVGAMTLIEGISGSEEVYLPEKFRAQMTAMFGEGVKPYLDTIYHEAMRTRAKWLSEAAFDRRSKGIRAAAQSDEGRRALEAELGREIEDENLSDSTIYKILDIRKDVQRKRNAIERMHRLASGYNSPNVSDEMTQTIAEIAADENVAAATRIFADGATRDQFYEQARVLGLATDKKGLKKLFVDAQDTLKAAKDAIKANHEQVFTDIAESSVLINEIQDAIWRGRQSAHEQQRAIADEYEKRKSPVKYYAGKVWTVPADLFNNMQASMEFSFLLRQYGRNLTSEPIRAGVNGIFGLVTGKPYDWKGDLKQQWGTVKKGAQAFSSGEKFGRVVMAIEHHPLFHEAVAMGGKFSIAGKIGTGHKAGEEQLSSSAIEKVANADWKNMGVLKRTATAIPVGYARGVQRFDDAMAAMGDALRMMMYERMATALRQEGLTPDKNEVEFRAIIKDINRSTGKRNKFETEIVEKSLDVLAKSRLMRAANYTVSNWQKIGADTKNVTLAIKNLIVHRQMPKGAQKQMLSRALYSYTALGINLAIQAAILGAVVSFDPDDDDFLKFKWGKYRYDVSFGLRTELKQIFKYAAMLMRGSRVPFEMLYDTVNYSTRYGRSKLGALPSFITDAVMGKDFKGDPVLLADWTTWAKLVTPMTYFNAAETVKEHGAGALARTMPAEFIGFGSSVYEDRPEEAKTPAEKLALKIKMMKRPWFSPTEYPDRIDNKTWSEVGKLKVRSRAGEDVSGEIATLVEAGKINDKIAKDVTDAKGVSLLVETMKDARLADNERDAILKVATPEEKTLIEQSRGTLLDRMKSASTDEAIKLWNEAKGNLNDLQQTQFKNLIRQKAENANKAGTLTREELERLKKIIPNLNIMPKAPKMPKVKKPVAPALQDVY